MCWGINQGTPAKHGPLAADGTLGDHMGSYGTIWDLMGPYGTLWDLMGPSGILIHTTGLDDGPVQALT